MINLIKMDLYRLIHSKVARFGLIAAAVLSILFMVGSFGLLSLFQAAIDEGQLQVTDLAEVSALFPMVSWLTNKVDAADIIFNNTNILSLLIGGIIAAKFVSAEHTSGYFKNIAGQVKHRGYTVGSKMIVTSLVQITILIIYIIFSLIFTPLLFGNYISGWSVGHLIGGLFLRALMFVAINTLIVFLCIVFKSQALSMVFASIVSLGTLQLLYMGLSSLVGILSNGSNFDFKKFMPDGINSMITVSELPNIALQGIIVSVIFIAVFTFGAILIVKKRDVR